MTVSNQLGKYIMVANINLPTKCPECGSALEILDNGFVRCTNKKCKQKVVHKIAACLNTLGVLGAGESMIRSFVDAGVDGIGKLFEYVPRMQFLGANEAKVANAITDALKKPMTIGRYVSLFDIDGFGERRLACLDNNATFQNLIKDPYAFKMACACGAEQMALFNKFDGITSDEVKLNMLTSIIDNLDDILDALKYVSLMEPSDNGVLKGLSFCFTGAMAYKRPVLEKLVTDNGGSVKGVSRGLSYLVQADENSTSTKSKKARELGTKIISPETFIGLLTNLGVNINF